MRGLLFSVPVTGIFPSLGLLLYRVAFGGMMLVGHGWPKLMAFSEKAATFPDPLGIGSTMSMAGAVAGEVACAALLVLGLGTRLAALPIAFTMGVAAFAIHAEGALFLPAAGAKEPALLYLAAFTLLFFTGPGRFSIDRILSAR
jgi:putative oxidoreductase